MALSVVLIITIALFRVAALASSHAGEELLANIYSIATVIQPP
jgi:hypothetical protein